MKEFTNIAEIYKNFPKKEDCIRFIEKIRWSHKPVCPHCTSHRISPMKKEFRYHCNSCNISFSVTVKTLFHNTRIPLQKWFAAIEIFMKSEKKISVRKLAETLDVNKDTAWTMLARIKKAGSEYGELFSRLIESGEIYLKGRVKVK
ncbi:MAG: transposase [Spirochaetia bacterium]|jgi:transposase-like protein|nr:transposase [Spirochaetia bacterium]